MSILSSGFCFLTKKKLENSPELHFYNYFKLGKTRNKITVCSYKKIIKSSNLE